jgi:hypothetical protein
MSYQERVMSSIRSQVGTWTVLALLLVPLAGCGDGGAQGSADASAGADTAAAAGADTAAGPEGAPPRFAFGNAAAEAQQCHQRLQQQLDRAAEEWEAQESPPRVHGAENPANVKRHGWWPAVQEFRDGSILPCNRIVTYYGNPNSTRMGALGEFPKDEMLSRLRRQVEAYRQVDPETPVVPALHMVAVVAQGDAGPSGHWRAIARDSDVEMVYGWAKEVEGIFFVDIQVGTDNIRNLLPRFDWILQNPDVHLGVDPEFMMKDGSRPGSRIGTMDAADVNYVIDHLAGLVREHSLPPKVLVIHRFTQRMVTNASQIRPRPEVQVVMHMDGWGQPWLKRDSYLHYMVQEPVQYPGFKIFYGNDTRPGSELMTPADLMALWPRPLYVQYQ